MSIPRILQSSLASCIAVIQISSISVSQSKSLSRTAKFSSKLQDLDVFSLGKTNVFLDHLLYLQWFLFYLIGLIYLFNAWL
jgi:hypothetical protein